MSDEVEKQLFARLDELQAALCSIHIASLAAYVDALYETWARERSVFLFGNGGSALTAMHLASDLVKTAAVEGKRRLRAISLAENTALLTAIANDIDYEEVFSYQIATHAEADDLAVAISHSGRSPNVLRACREARRRGLMLVSFTGGDGGQLRSQSDLDIAISSDDITAVESLHLAVGHAAALSLRDLVSRNEGGGTQAAVVGG